MNLQARINGGELGNQDYGHVSQPIPRGETNIHSILALEDALLPQTQLTDETNIDSTRTSEIKGHQQSTIELKRARNSLLNVSKLPPEVLGDIFCRNAIPEHNFEGFARRSYNFLLVCHHWFEVASCTPDLWSFWGNNMQDWAKRYLRYPAAPVDLVLDGVLFPRDTLKATLRKTLQDRAAADTIRRIHLIAEETELLRSIISPLIVNCDGIRSSSVESIIIWSDHSDRPVDISDFFAHYRFPKMRSLELVNCTISSWDLITSRTSALTILDLYFEDPTPNPTTAQLLSILSSNPRLRMVRLTGCTVPGDGGGMSSPRVPLHHLEELNLSGNFRGIVKLLHCLDHAQNTVITLCLRGGVVGDISRILGPYLRDYLRHRGSSPNGVDLSIFRADRRITLDVGDGHEVHPDSKPSLMTIMVFLSQSPPDNLLQKAILDLVAGTPRGEIISFRAGGNTVVMEDLYAHLPNLRTLYLTKVALSTALPKAADEDILPSLQHVFFSGLVVEHSDWGPLTEFVSRRASSGNKLASLTIAGSSYMRPEVAEGIRGMVGEFTAECLDVDSPSDSR